MFAPASTLIWASKRNEEAPSRIAPAPLPSAAECPPMLCVLEVVRHPAGGYTIARPVDATRTTQRVYQGQYLTRSAAQAALDRLF